MDNLNKASYMIWIQLLQGSKAYVKKKLKYKIFKSHIVITVISLILNNQYNINYILIITTF